MTVHRYMDARAFCRKSSAYLMREEASHNLLLGLCSAVCESPAPGPSPAYMATVEAAGQALGAALRTAPYNVVLSRMPRDAAERLARDMCITREPSPGVHGQVEQAEAFAGAWERLTGRPSAVRRRLRLFRLDGVTPALRAPGDLEPAGADDFATVLRFFEAFAREAMGEEPPDTLADDVKRRIDGGAVFLWRHRGAVASMACMSGTTPSGARVSGVYTPMELRGRGYASAAVAALSQRLLSSGRRFCVLYTDLSNPTSNRIYPRIGYRPLADELDVAFEAAPCLNEKAQPAGLAR